MDIFQFLHSWTRWLVVIVALASVGYGAMALAQNKAWDKTAYRLILAFSSLIGVQWILGLILIGTKFGSLGSDAVLGTRYFWEHLVIQTIALGVAHAHFSFRRRNWSDSVRYRNTMILVLVVFVIVFIGIALLPSGIQWRFYTGA